MKKALVVLSSPKTLYDFLWFYIEHGLDYKWDVLVHRDFLISGHIVEQTGIFSDIYVYDIDLTKKDAVYVLLLFLKMFVYMVFKRKEVFADSIIKKLTENKDYDLYVVAPFKMSILPGLFFLKSNSHKVVILEDGVGDYATRPNKWLKTNPHTKIYLAGDILGKMGYSDLTFQYDLKSFRNCVKCLTYPEDLEYNPYKEILKIRSFSGTNKIRYDALVKETFSIGDFENVDAILYTMPITDFTDEYESIVTKTQEFINVNYKGKKLALKRHPRDTMQYIFDSNIGVIEIDQLIPAEIIEEQIGPHISILMFASTIIQSIHTNNYIVLKYSDLQGRNLKIPYSEYFANTVKNMSINKENIVTI